ncbi:hypothetical protein [Campylobacter sputorum]|uniref:hypothetical protein n=1 Tax=Campylobacter sputorum TaxID=206 RepID=UPI000B78334C|nr:hypothetical protein [Campylobacter sputorum]
MIGSINGFESNLSYYNTNINLKENHAKQQLEQDSSNIKKQTINQTNENKLEESTKDIITKIKEKQKTQSKEEMAKDKARFRKYFYQSRLCYS